MRNLSKLLLALVAMSVLFSSCKEDVTEAPSVSLVAGTDFVSDGDTVFTEAPFQVKIEASAGTEDMDRLEVRENGAPIDISRILFDGDPAGSNPTPLDAATYGRALSWVITVTAPPTADVFATYTVVLSDAGGLTGQTSFDLGIAGTAPMLSIADETGFVKGGDSIFTDTDFVMKVTGVKGADFISEVQVQENGVVVDNSRLQIDGIAALANPFSVANSELEGFTYELTVKAPSDPDQAYTYTIIATDVEGRSGSVAIGLTTVAAPDPVTESTAVLLLNQGGPAGQGGLDLHTGTGTGSMDASADIVDKGIDINKPLATNWIQKIGVVNSSDLRIPDAAFSYDEIATVGQIEAAFEQGTTITESDVVQEGDMFLVLSDGTYFALIVTDINLTAADNKDYYEFSVKQ